MSGDSKSRSKTPGKGDSQQDGSREDEDEMGSDEEVSGSSDEIGDEESDESVSYTHLTLPTN